MSHTENGKVVCQGSFIRVILRDTVWETHPSITTGSCNKMKKKTVTVILGTHFFNKRKALKKSQSWAHCKINTCRDNMLSVLDRGDSSLTDVKRYQWYSRTEGQSKWKKDKTALLHLNCTTVTRAQCIPIFNLPVPQTQVYNTQITVQR